MIAQCAAQGSKEVWPEHCSCSEQMHAGWMSKRVQINLCTMREFSGHKSDRMIVCATSILDLRVHTTIFMVAENVFCWGDEPPGEPPEVATPEPRFGRGTPELAEVETQPDDSPGDALMPGVSHPETESAPSPALATPQPTTVNLSFTALGLGLQKLDLGLLRRLPFPPSTT